MQKTNVLIFPSGGENAIDVYDSLKYNLHFNVYGATSNKDHSEFIYDKDKLCIERLFITDVDFINRFNYVLSEFAIDYIIPTHDSIALFLMENEAKINAKIVCSPLETTKIAHSKKNIYESLKDTYFIPKVYSNIDKVEYPVFLKPDVAAGAKGTRKVNNKYELKEAIKRNDTLVICENLPGEEYTVDCFTDRNGKLIFIGPRTRERITMGISFKSKSVDLSGEIKRIAVELNKKFIFRGSWFFQIKRAKDGTLKLLEFSVRHAGTMSVYRQLGINFAALSIFDFMGLDVEILYNKYNIELDRYLKSSYKLNYEYDKLYIDLDDTLIVNNKVNTELIKLLYQAKGNNKQVILITKHEHDLDETLKEYYINKEIFDKIILIEDNRKKSDYIDIKKAIFIDNYFKERKEVHNKCKIPVFDVDAIQCLIQN